MITVTDADALIGEEPRGLGDRAVIDKGAGGAAEVFEEEITEIDDQPRVGGIGFARRHADGAALIRADDILTGWQLLAEQFRTVATYANLSLGDEHGGRFPLRETVASLYESPHSIATSNSRRIRRGRGFRAW